MKHMPPPAAARRSRRVLPAAIAAALLVSLAPPAAAGPAPLSEAEISAVAADLAALTGTPGPGVPDAFAAEIRALAEGMAGRDDFLRPLPAAIAQGAALARRAEHPASRAVFYDLTRDMVLTAVAETGADPEDSALLRAWQAHDPLIAPLGPGQGLAASDAAGMARLAALDPADRPRTGLRAFWDAQEEVPVNRIFPTRMAAWADGAAAAWDRLDDAQRGLVMHALDNAAVPAPDLLAQVIGTGDMLGWLAATDIPMTGAERAASPDLVRFMQAGAFAGPLTETLIAAASAEGAQIAISGLADPAGQLMRLNNWSAMTGEMHSWDSYRYMTQGW